MGRDMTANPEVDQFLSPNCAETQRRPLAPELAMHAIRQASEAGSSRQFCDLTGVKSGPRNHNNGTDVRRKVDSRA